MCVVVDPVARTFGWIERTDRVGICVDPFGEGAHMANDGGIMNVNRQGDDDPLMCYACWDRLRGIEGDPRDAGEVQ